jgi:hypothetical protein
MQSTRQFAVALANWSVAESSCTTMQRGQTLGAVKYDNWPQGRGYSWIPVCIIARDRHQAFVIGVDCVREPVFACFCALVRWASDCCLSCQSTSNQASNRVVSAVHLCLFVFGGLCCGGRSFCVGGLLVGLWQFTFDLVVGRRLRCRLCTRLLHLAIFLALRSSTFQKGI